MKSFLKSVIPALFILLFTYAAASKMLEATRFRAQLHLQPFSPSVADLLVYAVPGIELFTALLLLMNRTRIIGLGLSVALMAAFTGYISFLLLRGEKLPCSCGGILSHMSWTTHLIFNWAFLICAVCGIFLFRSQDYPKHLTSTQ